MTFTRDADIELRAQDLRGEGEGTYRLRITEVRAR